MDRQVGRQAGKQASTQAGRQASRQAGREQGRQKARQRVSGGRSNATCFTHGDGRGHRSIVIGGAQEQAQAASRAVKPHKGMRPAHTSIADLSMRLPLASHAATTGRDAADARLVDDWRDIILVFCGATCLRNVRARRFIHASALPNTPYFFCARAAGCSAERQRRSRRRWQRQVQ